jgi:hypothetical protein
MSMGPAGITTTRPRLRVRRLASEPGRTRTWEVIGHPFRLVALGSGWVLVPVGERSSRLLGRNDLLARPFRTRTEALDALDALLGQHVADAAAPAGGAQRDPRARRARRHPPVRR